jgi:hypothetical protein
VYLVSIPQLVQVERAGLLCDEDPASCVDGDLQERLVGPGCRRLQECLRSVRVFLLALVQGFNSKVFKAAETDRTTTVSK